MKGRNGYPKASQFARKAALLAGERFYQGARCGEGHDGTRYAASGNCVYCTRHRRWKEYWTTKAARLSAQLGAEK